MEYPLWSLIPFVAMLACIAVLPLIPATSHWWERNSSQLTVALVLAVPTTAWMFWKAGSAPLIDTGIEYFQFICLLFSLYVVSGGIHLAGDIRATPRNNTLFLAIGGVLASFIGTTGAAMLLIRPLLATNRERVNKVHTVLFTIFIVANCGGLLTPLGDPPLFLGFLNGVPFTWTLNLWKEWAFVLSILLLSYYSLDRLYYASEPKLAIEEDNEDSEPLRLHGAINLLFFAAIICSVAFLPSWDAEAIIEGHAHGSELVPWREIVMLLAAGLSLTIGNKMVPYCRGRSPLHRYFRYDGPRAARPGRGCPFAPLEPRDFLRLHWFFVFGLGQRTDLHDLLRNGKDPGWGWNAHCRSSRDLLDPDLFGCGSVRRYHLHRQWSELHG